jgi:hypothetical protein
MMRGAQVHCRPRESGDPVITIFCCGVLDPRFRGDDRLVPTMNGLK